MFLCEKGNLLFLIVIYDLQLQHQYILIKKNHFFFKSIHYQWISISLIIMLVYLLYYLISVFTLRITFLTKPEKNVCRCKFYDNVCLHGLYYLRSQLDQFPTFNEHCSLRYKKEFCNSLQKCKKNYTHQDVSVQFVKIYLWSDYLFLSSS